VNRATDSTEVTLPIRQVEVQILHEETECEMAHEACGFCTNGQTERGARWSCGGTGNRLTPSEWWRLHLGDRPTERTTDDPC